MLWSVNQVRKLLCIMVTQVMRASCLQTLYAVCILLFCYISLNLLEKRMGKCVVLYQTPFSVWVWSEWEEDSPPRQLMCHLGLELVAASHQSHTSQRRTLLTSLIRAYLWVTWAPHTEDLSRFSPVPLQVKSPNFRFSSWCRCCVYLNNGPFVSNQMGEAALLEAGGVI